MGHLTKPYNYLHSMILQRHPTQLWQRSAIVSAICWDLFVILAGDLTSEMHNIARLIIIIPFNLVAGYQFYIVVMKFYYQFKAREMEEGLIDFTVEVIRNQRYTHTCERGIFSC